QRKSGKEHPTYTLRAERARQAQCVWRNQAWQQAQQYAPKRWQGHIDSLVDRIGPGHGVSISETTSVASWDIPVRIASPRKTGSQKNSTQPTLRISVGATRGPSGFHCFVQAVLAERPSPSP